IQTGLDLLGGISMFVKSGERIVIKPNILIGTDPDKGVTSIIVPLLSITFIEDILIPPNAVIGLAGFTNCCKTGFCLQFASLNLDLGMEVYYFFNEMSKDQFLVRASDYTNLREAYKKTFFPRKMGESEFWDVIKPDTIAICDYIDRNDNLYLHGEDISNIKKAIGNGVALVGLQMQHKAYWGYGGLPTAKRTDLYFALDKVREREDHMECIAYIRKAKNWNKKNPQGLECTYNTGPKHGTLVKTGTWCRG
ncbi:hypothetical protein ACFLV5_06360, partial [Chloroflexota bacterium]